MGKKIAIAIILILLIGGGIFFYFYAFGEDKLSTKEYQDQVTTSLDLVMPEYNTLSTETSSSAFSTKVANINANLTVAQAAIAPEDMTTLDNEMDLAITNLKTYLTNVDYAVANGNTADVEPNFVGIQDSITQINTIYQQIMTY